MVTLTGASRSVELLDWKIKIIEPVTGALRKSARGVLFDYAKNAAGRFPASASKPERFIIFPVQELKERTTPLYVHSWQVADIEPAFRRGIRLRFFAEKSWRWHSSWPRFTG